MRRHLLRILDYLSIAAFVVTLAVWPLSDEILCDVRFGRLAAGVRGGGYYFADAENVASAQPTTGTGLGWFGGFRLKRGWATFPPWGKPIPLPVRNPVHNYSLFLSGC